MASSISNEGIENKYEILHDKELGRGTWSVVKKCTVVPPYEPPNASANAKFVVKIMEKTHLVCMTNGDMDRAIAEVYRELDVLRHIPAHPNIVPFIEYFETEKHFYLIFEEAPSGDLCELILRTSQNGEKIPEETAKIYIFQLIHAVLHCHLHDVVHRDIKPENLLVGENNHIRLTDFGLAKISKTFLPNSTLNENPLNPNTLAAPFECLAKKYCQCSDVIGTHRYGAPETFHAKIMRKHYDGFLADTWAVGIVAYIIMTGSFPFSAGANASDRDMYNIIMNTPLTFPSNVPPQAQSLIKSLLTKDAEKRLHLHEAVDHPWLSSVALNFLPESITIKQIKSAPMKENYSKQDVLDLLHQVNGEVVALNGALQKLRTEIIKQKLELSTAHHQPQKTETKRTLSARPGIGVRLSTPGRTATPLSSAHPNTPLQVVRPTPLRAPLNSPLPSPSRPVSVSGVSSSRNKSPVVAPISTGGSSATRRCVTPPIKTALNSNGNSSASPLARSNANTIRRGTPINPRATPLNSRGTTCTNSVVTPLRNSSKSGIPSKINGTSSSVSTQKTFNSGDQVIYHGQRATVHFMGTTGFGPGVWLGIEMLEGTAGINDGTSNVDKQRYFVCPKGKGLFVRPQQVQKN